MKKTTFIKQLIIGLCMLAAAGTYVFASVRSTVSINGNLYVNEEASLETVNSAAELEPPVHKKTDGKYYDDFDRLITDDLRKEAKEMYTKQQKSREITSLDEAVMPLIKITNLPYEYYNGTYSYNYYQNLKETDDENYYVYFYDSLGRKLSENLNKDAIKIYEKQRKKRESFNMNYSNFHEIWHFIWSTIKFIIIIMVIFFAASAFVTKVLKK